MITILGAQGFIGSHLVRRLRHIGAEHQAPARDEDLSGRPLGQIIYCIGLTADFRDRPRDAVDAHICRLLDLIRGCDFESLLYLSSARVYLRTSGPAGESTPLSFEPLDPDDLYGLTKAAGEALTLSLGAKGRVARPSNVYGPGQSDSFLAMLIDEAKRDGAIHLRTAPGSAKDYVSVADVADLLVRIAQGGRERIYNISSGVAVSHAQITDAIARQTGCSVHVEPGAPLVRFPPIENGRVRTEFGFQPASIVDDLPALIAGSA